MFAAGGSCFIAVGERAAIRAQPSTVDSRGICMEGMTMRFRHWARAMGAAIVALSLALTGCTTQAGDADHVLTVGYTTEPDGLDPSTVEGAATSQMLLYNVYETLVRDDGQGNIVGLLASDWDVSDDGRTYTFHLVPEATFASGAPVDAESVVATIDYIQEGQGAQAPVRGTVIGQMSVVEGATAVDPHTVEFQLSRPSNQWLYNMTGPTGIIYDPSGMDTLASQPAGSGPYTFVEWDTGSHLSLERNPDYWGEGPGVAGVEFRRYGDPNAMTSAMLSGQLDVISNLTTPESVGQFDDEEQFTVLEGYSNGEVVLGYNHDSEPLTDLRVRQAITHAIDRQALVDSIWGGQGALIGSMVPPQDPWYEDLSELYPYDPDRARELLAEAGYTASGPTLRLRVPVLPYATSGGRYVTAQLEEVGFDIELEEVEWAVWLDDIFANANYDMTIVAHVEPRDMDAFARPEFYWRYDNPEYQDLLTRADEGTPEEQSELLRQAGRLLAEDAAGTWLFLLPNIVVTTSDVSGISANVTNLAFDLTSVQVDR